MLRSWIIRIALLVTLFPVAARAQLTLPFEGSASVDWGDGSQAVFKITNTGTAHGLLGLSENSAFGVGVCGRADAGYGVVGQSYNDFGIGVWGSAFSTTGSTNGGFFDCYSDTGIGVRGVARANTGLNYGGFFDSASTGGVGLFSRASATSGLTHAGIFENDSPSGNGIDVTVVGPGGVALSASNNAGGMAGSFSGRVTVSSNDASNAALIVQNTVGGTAGAFTGTLSASTGGVNAVVGSTTATNGTGGSFSASGTTGIGVTGNATANSGATTGGRFTASSTSGTGVLGQANAATGTTYGGKFTNSSTSGTGVYGQSTATSGTAYGVYGTVSSTSGNSVYGKNTATTGSASAIVGECSSASGSAALGRNLAMNNSAYLGYSGYGVYAVANSAAGMGVRGDSLTTDSGVGVYGRSNNNINGFGVYALGRLGASGTKSFQIDHPLDPESMYLFHYCTEGPEPLNVYRGNVTLDEKGEAWITLPRYFAEINRDPSYQLTPVGSAAPKLHVSKPIADNRFQVAGGTPGLTVSWRVEAVRNDRFVRAYGAPVEVAKPESARGTYLQPELYDQPDEHAQDYVAPAPVDASGAPETTR